jgi:hypothetical protein
LHCLFRPYALKIVNAEFGMCGDQPPQGVHAEVALCILVQLTLTAVLLFQLVNVALVFIYTLKLFCKNLISKECEQNAFHESNYAHNERNGVARSIHMDLGFFCSQEVVE